jgi:aminopeptidase N
MTEYRSGARAAGILGLIALLAVAGGARGAEGPMSTSASVAIEPGVSAALARLRAEVVSDVSYELQLAIPEDAGAPMRGRVVASFELDSTEEPLQFDFAAGADQVLGVFSEGVALPYEVLSEHVVVAASALRPGRNRIAIDYVAPQNAINRNPDYLFTLFVPDRARTAFPLFDQPDLKARFRLTLETPGDWTALSNASLLGEAEKTIGGESEGRQQFRFAATEPIPSYLFSFVAGRFERISRTVGGRPMTMLHRETDRAKLARNVDAIFELHGGALAWLEEYTGIDYPFGKFDFVLIPDFTYGGMEHVGAIQYRASSLLLEDAPSDNQRLNRAQLIAHETAHMWFGDLVTMRWFDDVWTKEVFANFMADKIVNPAFTDIDHELSFLVSHYPDAYGVDRTQGANPIRQPLANLNQAGQLYGPIIYHKAPIMMRQLELLLGEAAFRDGLRSYLQTFAYGNADWPALIAILDKNTDIDLRGWSEVWVNSAGRPEFTVIEERAGAAALQQRDPAGSGREWPQRFGSRELADGVVLHNADGLGYGLFPSQFRLFEYWNSLSSLERGVLLIGEYENLLEGRGPGPDVYFDRLRQILAGESNPLLIDLAAGQLYHLYFSLLSDSRRAAVAGSLEEGIWSSMLAQSDASGLKRFYELYLALATTADALQRLEAVWDGSVPIEGLSLAEPERVTLAEVLAVRQPGRAEAIIAAQLAQTENPDRQRRLAFIAPALSPDAATRDAFFESLALAENRRSEVWVSDALRRLHDPTRLAHSQQYLARTFEQLEAIQRTGDIFFPSAWLTRSLANHHSDVAVAVVRDFLAARPDYPPQLRMKILQAADPLFRANRLRR